MYLNSRNFGRKSRSLFGYLGAEVSTIRNFWTLKVTEVLESKMSDYNPTKCGISLNP